MCFFCGSRSHHRPRHNGANWPWNATSENHGKNSSLSLGYFSQKKLFAFNKHLCKFHSLELIWTTCLWWGWRRRAAQSGGLYHPQSPGKYSIISLQGCLPEGIIRTVAGLLYVWFLSSWIQPTTVKKYVLKMVSVYRQFL